MRKILFTGGGGAGNEAIYRLLSGRYEMHFADADVTTISPSIPEKNCHEIPYANDTRFISELTQICYNNKIDLLIPGVDEELLKASKMDIPVMLPDLGYINIMLDKLSMANTIANMGIDSPRTITAYDFLHGKNILFPCIIKPKRGRGSRNVNLLKQPDQVAAYMSMTGISADEVVLQELLKGQEYTVLMGADSEGVLKVVVPVKVDVKRGITLRAETENNEDIIARCIDIHEKLPAKGCYNIQLMYTEDSRIVPFEINPRISTTFCLSVAAGIDPVGIYLNDDLLEDVSFKSGVKIIRYWINMFA